MLYSRTQGTEGTEGTAGHCSAQLADSCQSDQPRRVKVAVADKEDFKAELINCGFTREGNITTRRDMYTQDIMFLPTKFKSRNLSS